MTPFQILVLRALAAIIRLQLPTLPVNTKDDQYETIRLSLELEEAAASSREDEIGYDEHIER